MEAIEAILTRRSIRKYSEKEISPERIKQLLEAAMQAPSANNCQPWHFVIISDKKTLTAIREFHPGAQMLNEASCAILICGYLKLQSYKTYWAVDCGAATQNLLIAAHAIGLGAVWLGVYPRDERMNPIKKLFNLPENIQPFALVSIGYPAEEKEMVYRYKPERVHYEKW